MFQSDAINYVTIKEKGSMFLGNCCQIHIIVIVRGTVLLSLTPDVQEIF